METYVKKAEDLEAVNANFMPPLLDAILGDYNTNVPAARDAEVLNVMATIISRLGVSMLSAKLYWDSFGRLDSSNTSSAGYPRCGLRANTEYDKSRLR
jgi:hypothetical protein